MPAKSAGSLPAGCAASTASVAFDTGVAFGDGAVPSPGAASAVPAPVTTTTAVATVPTANRHPVLDVAIRSSFAAPLGGPPHGPNIGGFLRWATLRRRRESGQYRCPLVSAPHFEPIPPRSRIWAEIGPDRGRTGARPRIVAERAEMR